MALWPLLLLGAGIGALALAGSTHSDYTWRDDNPERFRLWLSPRQRRTTRTLRAGVHYKLTVSGYYRLCRLERVFWFFMIRRWHVADARSWSSSTYAPDERPASGRFTLPHHRGVLIDGKDDYTPFREHPVEHGYSFYIPGQDRPVSLEIRPPSWAAEVVGELEVTLEPLTEAEEACVPELVEAKRVEEEELRAAAERLLREWREERRMAFDLPPGREVFTPQELPEGEFFSVSVRGTYYYHGFSTGHYPGPPVADACYDASCTRIFTTRHYPLSFDGVVVTDEPLLVNKYEHRYSFAYRGTGARLSFFLRAPEHGYTNEYDAGTLRVTIAPLSPAEHAILAEREEVRRLAQEEGRMAFELEPNVEVFSPEALRNGERFSVTLSGTYNYTGDMVEQSPGSYRSGVGEADACYDARGVKNFTQRYPGHLSFDGAVITDEPLQADRAAHVYTFAYTGTGARLAILLRAPKNYKLSGMEKLRVAIAPLSLTLQDILAARAQAQAEKAEAQERQAAAAEEQARQEQERQQAEAERQRHEKAGAAIRERVEQLVRRVKHFGYVENPAYIAGFARENKDWLLKGRAAIIAAYDNFHSDPVFIQRLKDTYPRAYERSVEVWHMKALAQAEQTAFEQPPPPPPWRSYTVDEEAVLMERVERLVRNTQHDGFVENPSFIAGFARKNMRYLLSHEEAIVARYDNFHSDKLFVQRLRDTNLHAYERAKPVWEMKALAEARRISVDRKTEEQIGASLLRKVQGAADTKISVKKQIAAKIVEAHTILDPFDLDPDERQQLETDLIQQILELEDTSNGTAGKETL